MLRGLLAEYTAQHPDTTFKLQLAPYDGYDQKLAQGGARHPRRT